MNGTKHRKRLGPGEDVTPHIRPAGLANSKGGHDAGECLAFGGDFARDIPKNRTLPAFAAHIPGRLPANITAVSAVAKPMTHGDRSANGDQKPNVLELPRNREHPLLKEVAERRERIYRRQENQVLGKSVVRLPLPPEVLESDRPFGVQTQFDISAGQLIRPDPPDNAGDEESVHRMYVRSHGSYRPGEQCERRYRFDREKVWGLPSGVDTYGGKVSEAMFWKAPDGGLLMSKKVKEFLDKSKPKLGKVFDPIADTMHVPPDHTFGYKPPSDEYGVGDLIRRRGAPAPAEEDDDDGEFEEGAGGGKPGGGDAPEYRAETAASGDRTDCPRPGERRRPEPQSKDSEAPPELQSNTKRSRVAPKIGTVESLRAARAAVRKDEFVEKVGLRRVEELMALAAARQKDARPPIPGMRRKYLTTADDDHEDIRPSEKATDMEQKPKMALQGLHRTYGVPSIRTDITPPKLPSLGDNQNYGDELDAKNLMCPDPRVFHNVEYLEGRLRRMQFEETRRIGYVAPV